MIFSFSIVQVHFFFVKYNFKSVLSNRGLGINK